MSGQIYKVFCINADTGWAVFNGNQLHKTTNGGTNWFFQLTSTGPLYSIFFLNGQKGWAGGRVSGPNPNGIIYTTNGGINWTNASGVQARYDVHFVNDSVGWAGSIEIPPAKIAKSTDGGRTWGYQNALANSDISIAIIKGDTNNVWAGRSILIHTSDGGGPLTDIEPISSILPSEYKLFQNYPNPFNPTTNIRFRISKFGFVQLNVYDINGKLIESLINKNMPAGEYKTDFNASNLPSGIYFYTLITEKFKETKKMLLLK